MTLSGPGRYRGTNGVLTVGGGSLTFTRTDGMISKRQYVVAVIPVDAIQSMAVEGLIVKKLVVLVDGRRVPGIPRHEYEVPDPQKWMFEIQKEMSMGGPGQPYPYPPIAPVQQTYVKETIREVVKVPCKYCGHLNETTWQNCPSCGAPLG